jgi:hypothetical protein
MRTQAESTKLRIVYDASAQENPQETSLNDCLYAGPPLQNRLWNVLVRMRFHPVAVTGDIKQAFLQVRIRKAERDSLRFHWKSNKQSLVETLRFTRALFGLVCSPLLLGGVVERHLESWEEREPELVTEIRRSLYVDNLLSGKPTVGEAKDLKEGAIKIFQDAKFTLHKWHSNNPELESEQSSVETENTFAKQQLGAPTDPESSLLGLSWNKETDEFSVVVPEMKPNVTKRELLSNLASIYDPLGLVAPVTLKGKTIYRETCKAKTAWDASLPEPQAAEYGRWVRELPRRVTVPRALTTQREAVEEIELHTFGDASGKGVCAALYAIVKQGDEKIKLQFNQFERMVGLVKSALYKSIGNGFLTKKELEDVLLDIETTLNNRPLGYQEDDIQMPTLTPNSLQFVGSTHLPEPEHYHEADPDLRKRAKYLKKCKDHMWNRWTKEYLRALRERHNLKHDTKPFSLAVGDVVIIYSEERNRGKWPLGIVQELYPGRDGVIRAAKIKTGNGHLERAVNLLYPLELSCDIRPSTSGENLNPEAAVFRPTREAAVTARLRIQEQANDDEI